MLYHLFNALTNTKGDSLPGYQVRLVNSTTKAIAPIYSDINGTPIVTVSGIANVAITDASGNYSLFVEAGTYDLQFLTPGGAFIKAITDVPMSDGVVTQSIIDIAATAAANAVRAGLQADLAGAQPIIAAVAAGQALVPVIQSNAQLSQAAKDITVAAVGYPQRKLQTIPGDVLHFDEEGQSLRASGIGGGNFTTVPNGPSFAWPQGVSSPVQGSQVPLTATSVVATGVSPNTSDVPVGQSPMFGMVAMIRQLLRDEDGIPDAAQPIIFVGNNAVGSSAISAHIKGTAPYQRGQQQALATRAYGQNNAKRGRYVAKMWGQGEANFDTPAASYYATLLQLAQDNAADYRAAAPEQTFDPRLVTYQTASLAGSQRYGVARAQHKLAVDYSNLVGFSRSIYDLFYGFDNGGYPSYNAPALHPSKVDAHYWGAAEGLYLKRALFDLVDSRPIQPIARQDSNGTVFLTMFVRWGARLIKDTTFVAQQPNNGVSCVNENTNSGVGFDVPPDITPQDMLTIALKPTGGIVNGLRFDFGQTAAVGMYPYVGGATNFRTDTRLRFTELDRPMFEPFPIMSIRLTNTGPGFELVL